MEYQEVLAIQFDYVRHPGAIYQVPDVVWPVFPLSLEQIHDLQALELSGSIIQLYLPRAAVPGILRIGNKDLLVCLTRRG